jgi:hypothetical protein
VAAGGDGACVSRVSRACMCVSAHTRVWMCVVWCGVCVVCVCALCVCALCVYKWCVFVCVVCVCVLCVCCVLCECTCVCALCVVCVWCVCAVCHHTIIHWRSRFEGETCSCGPFQCKDISNHETWVVASAVAALVSALHMKQNLKHSFPHPGGRAGRGAAEAASSSFPRPSLVHPRPSLDLARTCRCQCRP